MDNELSSVLQEALELAESNFPGDEENHFAMCWQVWDDYYDDDELELANENRKAILTVAEQAFNYHISNSNYNEKEQDILIRNKAEFISRIYLFILQMKNLKYWDDALRLMDPEEFLELESEESDDGIALGTGEFKNYMKFLYPKTVYEGKYNEEGISEEHKKAFRNIAEIIFNMFACVEEDDFEDEEVDEIPPLQSFDFLMRHKEEFIQIIYLYILQDTEDLRAGKPYYDVRGEIWEDVETVEDYCEMDGIWDDIHDEFTKYMDFLYYDGFLPIFWDRIAKPYKPIVIDIVENEIVNPIFDELSDDEFNKLQDEREDILGKSAHEFFAYMLEGFFAGRPYIHCDKHLFREECELVIDDSENEFLPAMREKIKKSLKAE